MISEVDIKDWQEAVSEAYTEFVTDRGGEKPYGSEVWEAAANWAFEYMFERSR
jgi:hypothetical protein